MSERSAFLLHEFLVQTAVIATVFKGPGTYGRRELCADISEGVELHTAMINADATAVAFWRELRIWPDGGVPEIPANLEPDWYRLALGITDFTPSELRPPLVYHMVTDLRARSLRAYRRPMYWILAARKPHPGFVALTSEDRHWLGFHFPDDDPDHALACMRLTPVLRE